MIKKIIPFFLIFPLIFPAYLYTQKSPKLPEKYKNWLEQEVVYIITSKEEEVFKELETDKQRDLFVEEFWKQRDPTPGTPQNEFKEEHYRRIEYANKFFSRGTPIPGWKTERGRVYIILGEPISRDRFSNSHYIYPTEMWLYQGNVSKGLPSIFYIVFYKRWGAGDFILYSPLRDGPQVLLPLTSHELSYADRTINSSRRAIQPNRSSIAYGILEERVSVELAEASISLIPGSNPPIDSDRLLEKVDSSPQRIVDDEYAYEFLRNKATVEVSYSVHYIGNTSVVKAIQDESGLFFIHYSIQPQNLSVEGYKDKYYSNIKISGRIADLKGKTVFQYNREYPLEFSKEQIKQLKLIPMAIQDSFPLVSGNYRFSLLFENTVSKEFTSFDKDIIIPEIEESLKMSELVLAYMKKKDEEPLKSSFKVEKMIFFPCLKREFTSKDTLILFFQLYRLPVEFNEGGWIRYTFFKNGEKHHVKKKRVMDYKSKKNFLEEFSLKNFPPARYGVKVSVLDRNEKEVVFKEDKFSLSSKISARPWVQFKIYPASGDAVYSFIRGMQFLNKGEMQGAQGELKKAYEMRSEREDFAIAYARVLLGKEAYEEIIEVLNPFAEKPIEDYNLYSLLGRAHQGLEEYEEAISCYQKHISHEGASFKVLNSIGECYFKIGNHKEALRAWERSLEINPAQEKIKKLVKNLKEKK